MHIDTFFFFGERDLKTEVEEDIIICLTTPQNSMYYYRSYGAGIHMYENTPNDFTLQTLVKFVTASALSRRNIQVPNGSNQSSDYRAVTSQSVIDVSRTSDGVQLVVPYLPMFDIHQQGQVNLTVVV